MTVRAPGALAALALLACSRASEPKATRATRSDAPAPVADASQAATAPRALQLALGHAHTCVLLSDGAVRCWGLGVEGQLGTASTASIGDDEPAFQGRAVELGGRAIAITAGDAHTCALMESKHLRCWGRGKQGQLGYGEPDNIGDDETPASVGDVPLSTDVASVSAGENRTCALLQSGAVRCWGDNHEGGLGLPGRRQPTFVGDDEAIESMPPITFGQRVVQLESDSASSCVLFDNGKVRCWGAVQGSVDPDDEAAKRSDIDVGAEVAKLSGARTMCVITKDAHARCWGQGAMPESVGVDHNSGLGFPGVAFVGDLPLKGTIERMALGGDHGCAIIDGGAVRCWGDRRLGILGAPPGDVVSMGDALDVDVGAPAVDLAIGAFHTCVITSAGGVRCWGMAKDGRLGYGTAENVGAARRPRVAGDVPLVAP